MATPPLSIVNPRGNSSTPGSRSTSPVTGSPASSRTPSPTTPGAISGVRLPGLRAAPADRNNLLGGHGRPTKRFNFSDSHLHHKNYRQNGLALTKYIEYMDSLGIQYTTLMPIPTSVSFYGGQARLEESVVNCGCSPDYYLLNDMIGKKSITRSEILKCASVIQLFPHTDVDDDTASLLGDLKPIERERLDPMITGLLIGMDDCSTSLLRKLDRYPGVFTGVGEITVHKEVVDDLLRAPWANLATNRNPLLQLLNTCGKIGMPVVLHCDVSVHGEGPDIVPKYLADLKKLFAHEYARDTTIVWAHAGGLGRFVNAPGGHVGALQTMLKDPDFAHVHIDLSWKVVAERLTENAETIDEWAALISNHPTRFLFGSDSLVPKDTDTWNATFRQYDPLFAKLTEDCVEKVTLKNYERVFVGAREKVRKFERDKLPGIMAERQTNYENHLYGRTSAPAYVASGTVIASSASSAANDATGLSFIGAYGTAVT
jgi:hypothetical protein